MLSAPCQSFARGWRERGHGWVGGLESGEGGTGGGRVVTWSSYSLLGGWRVLGPGREPARSVGLRGTCPWRAGVTHRPPSPGSPAVGAAQAAGGNKDPAKEVRKTEICW